MIKFQQTVLIKSGQTKTTFLTEDVLQKEAPSYLECPDFKRVIVQDIKITRVCNDRSGVYSVFFTDTELMDHVTTLRNPDGDRCLAVLDPLGGYELKHPEKQPRPVSVQQVADDPLIESEFHNNTLDVTSVLFVWANNSDRKQPKVVSAEEEADIILKHRRWAHIFDATQGMEVYLVNHIDTESDGPILLTFDITLGLVESSAINDKTRRSPSV